MKVINNLSIRATQKGIVIVTDTPADIEEYQKLLSFYDVSKAEAKGVLKIFKEAEQKLTKLLGEVV